MAFRKRKYADYGGFELPEKISTSSLKRLQSAIGAGLFTKVAKEVEPETPVETPETGDEEQNSQN